jgi:hypothetical protein
MCPGVGIFCQVSKTRRLLDSVLVELDTVTPRARSGVGWVRVRMQETIGKVLNSTSGKDGVGNIGCRVLVTIIEGLLIMLNMSATMQCRQAVLVARNLT